MAACLLAAIACSAALAPPLPPPSDFAPRVTNPWFPLTPGTTLRYRGEEDGVLGTDVFTVTRKTKRILGVKATVVHDRIWLDGRGLVEDTLDWYAQDKRGTVWYLGEATKELDHGRVTSREGSWQAGVRGAQAGVFMPAHPRVGQVFRQEYYKGHAEDHVQIVTIKGRRMKTKEWTPLEPGVRDRKIYARGVGTVLEQTVKGGDERWELVAKTRS